jgi:hypothetical protein
MCEGGEARMATEDCVRRRAYEIWEQNGKPEGRSEEHWAQAHREIEDKIGLGLKQAELDLKRGEAALKQVELNEKSGWRRWTSGPLTPILVTAIIGFIISQITSYTQSRESAILEQEKLRSSLILKAIDTTSSAASAKTLLFLLGLKLIDDPTGKIAALEQDPQNAPFLGSGAVPVTPSATAGREFLRARMREKRTPGGARILPDRARTAPSPIGEFPPTARLSATFRMLNQARV